MGRAQWVAHSGSRVPREARRHRAGERWRQRRADRSSRDVVCSCLLTREDRRILPGGRTARDAALHRARRPTHFGRPAQWVARKWVARPARGSPASCRRAMASTPRGSFLSRCGLFVSLYSGGSAYPVRGQGGAGRRPAPDGTSNPLGIGRDAQPTLAALHSGSRESGSRVPREARRHRAGERWRQRRADRSSRDVVCSCLFTREDLRILSGAGRRGTPPCTVGRASRARLAGILPGSDGVKETQIAPLAMWCVRVSRLSGRSSHLAPNRAARDAALHRARRPTHRHGSRTVGRASRARLAGIVPASDGVNAARIVPLAMWFVRVSLLGTICVSCPGAGRRGTPPCTVGRASRARLAGIVPASDGVNPARIVPLAMWFVRVSLLGRICVSCPGAGRRGTPPCIGRDVQPTGHRARRPTHFGRPAQWVARPARGSPA